MKTLDEVKEEIAKEYGYANWIGLYTDCAFRIGTFERYTDKVALRYTEMALNEFASRIKTSMK